MSIRKLAVVCCLAFSSVALGGGGGSSTGSGGGGSGVGGVYSGTETLTLSAAGIAPQQLGTFPITIVISNGRVTLTDSEDVSGSAPLSADGNNFRVALNFTVDFNSGRCNFSDVYSGTISGNRITGTISGTAPCSGGGASFTVTTSGTFSANLTNAARYPSRSNKAERLSDIVGSPRS